MDRCYNGKNLRNLGISKGDSYDKAVKRVHDILTKQAYPWLEEDCDTQRKKGCTTCKSSPDYQYCGEYLGFLNIQPGEHYESVFEKIDEALEGYSDTCEESRVLINNVLHLVLQAGEQQNINILNTEGTGVGTKVAGNFVVPDGDVTINTISVGSVPSGEQLDLTLVDQDDVPLVFAQTNNEIEVTITKEIEVTVNVNGNEIDNFMVDVTDDTIININL